MRALVLVDIQNDFVSGGSLAVADGDGVVSVANRFVHRFDLVVATQDWHPADHGSFATNHVGHVPGDVVELGGVAQVLWPPHCVQNTAGASFCSALDITGIGHVIRKGTDPGIDSYSAFFDNHHLRATGLEALLREWMISGIVVMGLATDYCVKFTALDARELGFEVTLVEDGCRAVDLEPGDGMRAFDEMRAAGCAVILSTELETWLLGQTRPDSPTA